MAKSISPEVIADPKESIKINKELSSMQERYDLAKEYTTLWNQLEEAREIPCLRLTAQGNYMTNNSLLLSDFI